ncbi:MAG TPA: AraC family transcriptional regulator [Streptosporangiaceae bacterium]|nr:AraC family transcriptional regulator [Streptosporangiaceae bacterium]
MNKRDAYPDLVAGGTAGGPARASAGLGRGVLHQAAAAGRFQLVRHQPSAALAPFVEYYWIVRWDLRGRLPHEQTILPHPNVHLVFEEPVASIYGVEKTLFVQRIEGRSQVLGVRFRAGGFRPFWTGPVSQLNDRTVAAAELFGPAAEKARRVIVSAPDDAGMVAEAEDLLGSVRPKRDPVAEQVAAVVDRIVGDPSLRRVDELAAVLHVPVRRLQRLFADYVGVSPKWVMRRARLHEAAERADSGIRVDWAELAHDLGYADQAHLTRDFTATIGVPPARYAGI